MKFRMILPLLLALLPALFSTPVSAVDVSRYVSPYETALTVSGATSPGDTLTFFVTDTATPALVYTTAVGDTALGQPVTAGAGGVYPEVFLDADIIYRVIWTRSDATTVTVDDISPGGGGAVKVVSNYADLKGLGVAQLGEGREFRIESRATIGDGGQGFFYVTQTNPGADDGGTILHSDTAGWYFIRKDITSVNVGAFGAVGDGDGADGGTDDAAAFELALNSGYAIELTIGKIYLIERPLVITATRYKIFSQQSQRGTNALAQESTYKTATIDYNPTTDTDYLIDIYSVLNAPSYLIGPFEHENITFLLGESNGIRIGDPSQDPIDATTQAYVFHPTFKGCAFHATATNRASVSGVITRTGQTLVYLTKAFEAVFEDNSFRGGDYQIRLKGNDFPTIRSSRFQHGNAPIFIEGSGTFNAMHTLDDLQFEGWLTSPINSFSSANVAASNIRMEQTDNSAGNEVYDLTAALSITAAVTADNASLTFSQAMDGILFPGETIIQLSDGTNTDNALVETVSGTAVTVYGGNLTLTWTDAAANVTRIHSYGPLHNSTNDASYVGVSGKGGEATPAFVYVMNRGSMSVANAQMQKSGDSYSGSMVIGNHFKEQGYLNQSFSFSGSSPFILPDPAHPVVSVDNWRPNSGLTMHQAGSRAKLGSLGYAFQVPLRKWAFTPGDTASSANNSHLTPFVEIDGDTNTNQKIWAWHKRTSPANLQLSDNSLPSVSTQYIRVRIKAKAVTGTPNLSWDFRGAGTSSTKTIALTTAWSTTEYVQPVPTEWQGVKTVDFGFRLTGSDYYVAGVTVEEVGQGQWIQHPTDHTGITASASITWDDIPAWATKIEIAYADFSSTATQELFVRIGDASSVEATGYSGRTAATSGGDAWSTEAPATNGLTASDVANGKINMRKVPGSDQWVINLTSVPETAGSLVVGAGDKTLTGTLTRAQLLVGTGTIDSGDFVLYFE